MDDGYVVGVPRSGKCGRGTVKDRCGAVKNGRWSGFVHADARC